MSNIKSIARENNNLQQCLQKLAVVTELTGDKFQHELNIILDDLNSWGYTQNVVDNEV